MDEEERYRALIIEMNELTRRNIRRGLTPAMARAEAIRVMDVKDSLDFFQNQINDYESSFQTDGEEYGNDGRSTDRPSPTKGKQCTGHGGGGGGYPPDDSDGDESSDGEYRHRRDD